MTPLRGNQPGPEKLRPMDADPYRLLDAALERWQTEARPPTGLEGRVLERLRSTGGGQRQAMGVPRSLAFSLHPGRWALAAAAALVCTLGGLSLFGHPFAGRRLASSKGSHAAVLTQRIQDIQGIQSSAKASPDAHKPGETHREPSPAAPMLATAAARRQPAGRVPVGTRHGRASQGLRDLPAAR